MSLKIWLGSYVPSTPFYFAVSIKLQVCCIDVLSCSLISCELKLYLMELNSESLKEHTEFLPCSKSFVSKSGR